MAQSWHNDSGKRYWERCCTVLDEIWRWLWSRAEQKHAGGMKSPARTWRRKWRARGCSSQGTFHLWLTAEAVAEACREGGRQAAPNLQMEVTSEALQGAALQRRCGPQVQVVQPRECRQERNALCARYHRKNSDSHTGRDDTWVNESSRFHQKHVLLDTD